MLLSKSASRRLPKLAAVLRTAGLLTSIGLFTSAGLLTSACLGDGSNQSEDDDSADDDGSDDDGSDDDGSDDDGSDDDGSDASADDDSADDDSADDDSADDDSADDDSADDDGADDDSADDDSADDDGGEPPEPGDPIGESSLLGVVTDVVTGARLRDVTVRVVGGDVETETDELGEFAVGELPEGNVNLEFTKDGYAPGYATAELSGSSQSAMVSLKREGERQYYDPTATQTLVETTEVGPYAVIFEADSLDTEDTALTVSVTPLDPTFEAAALPGDLVAGGDSPVALNAVTFAEFTILDSLGERVQLKDSASAIVELPIPLALRSKYELGSKIHCYAYNPETGRWEDFVEGTVETSSVDGSTPVLRAMVRHFSWYGGAPAIEDQTCAYVQVFSQLTGMPLVGAVVSASPGTKGTTDAGGLAAITVERGVPVKFVATKTYPDTYVDANDNLVPSPGSKVIEIGRVEEDALVPLVSGPCPEGSTSGDADPIRIETGLAPPGAYLYEVNATLVENTLSVTIMEGVADEEGQIEDPELSMGGRVFLEAEGEPQVELDSLPGVGGYFTLPADEEIEVGVRYTVSVDVDGNGTIDATGAATAVGTPEFVRPEEGETYSASDFEVEWTDAGPGVFYYATLVGPGVAGYSGDATSFTPDPELEPGEYSATLTAMSGISSDQSLQKNIVGVGVSGYIFGIAYAEAVNFTLE